MGLDDTVNLERLATAFEKLATALDRLATIEHDKFVKQYPPEREKRAAEVIKPDSDKREQYSDKGDPDWFNETEKAAGTPSRFEQRRIDQESEKGAKEPDAPKRRGTAPIH